MECKFAVICKFCKEPERSLILPEWQTGRLVSLGEATKELAAAYVAGKKRVYTRKTLVGGGSIKEKLAGRVWHCKKCDFTAPNAGVMASHCRLTHPKRKTGHKPEKKTAAGLKPTNDKKAEHAFKALQKRANKGKLTEEQTTVFDNLEPSIIGKRAKDWPDGCKESVIKLYKDVTGAGPGEEE